MPKHRPSSKTSTNVRRPKIPRVVKNVGIKQHGPCKACSDLNPDLFEEINTSVTTNLVTVKESNKSGCKFCRMVYETYNYYYQTNNQDWSDFRFAMEFGSGKPVQILRRAVLRVRYSVINLYAPIGMLFFPLASANIQFSRHFV
jgi:hypothetical protein